MEKWSVFLSPVRFFSIISPSTHFPSVAFQAASTFQQFKWFCAPFRTSFCTFIFDRWTTAAKVVSFYDTRKWITGKCTVPHHSPYTIPSSRVFTTIQKLLNDHFWLLLVLSTIPKHFQAWKFAKTLITAVTLKFSIEICNPGWTFIKKC